MSGNFVPTFWVPHQVQMSDTLNSLARNYGYQNPGPIFAFNADRLPGAIVKRGEKRSIASIVKQHSLKPNQINSAALKLNHAGLPHGNILTLSSTYDLNYQLVAFGSRETWEIPWTRNAIDEFVSFQKKLRAQIIVDTYKDFNWDEGELRKLQTTLLLVDLLAMLVKGGADFYQVASKHSAMLTDSLVKMEDVLRSIYKLFIMKGLRTAGAAKSVYDLRAKRLAYLSNLQLPEPFKKPGKGFSFFLGNTIGFLSPSWWTSMAGALSEGDADILWYGPEAIDIKTKNEILSRAKSRVRKIDDMISAAEMVRGRSFYAHQLTNDPFGGAK